MQKPNLDNVKKHFEEDGWKVTVDYKHDHIILCADKIVQTGPKSNAAETLEADFAYRKEDMEHADKKFKKEIQEYIDSWGDAVNYSGTPAGVQSYEGKFGASSVAGGQKVKGEKSVTAVEAAFKKAGYMVTLTPSDKGTEKELWQMNCILPSPMNTLVAGHGYSADWAKQIGEANVAAAKSQNMGLKCQDNWFYYGSPDAIDLFESLGGGEISVLFAPVKQEKDESVAKLEEAFKKAGYTVTLTPMGEMTMATCMMASPFSMLTGILCSSADAAKTSSKDYAPSAEAMKMEVKCKGKWFYYGSPDAVKVFEGVIK
jgi:predicted ArsR family transcriptional regulator